MPACKIKILIVSSTPWDDSNSFGSSFSNIFGGIDRYEIANIYLKQGEPNTIVPTHFFQITYKDIINKLCGCTKVCGREVVTTRPNQKNEDSVAIKFAKKHRWQILFWIQDLIWATNVWKTPELDRFIREFNPDIIFQPIYYSPHINKIGLYAQKLVNVPMIGYTSDDNYSLRQHSWSPLFWIDRLVKRQLFKQVVDRCRLLYVITETQRIEYDKYFGPGKCKILYKGGEFSGPPPVHNESHPLKLLYTGNLGGGRAETLIEIAKALQKLNSNGQKAYLEIYSATPLTTSQIRNLNIDGSSTFKGFISVDEVLHLQQNSDILVHVESFDKYERYKSRLSLSTKIVDYLQSAKPILSVGWAETGGLQYLDFNNATLAVTNLSDIESSLYRIINDKELREYLSHNAWSLGKKNHQISIIRNELLCDIIKVIERKL